jgi:hypothetical protein
VGEGIVIRRDPDDYSPDDRSPAQQEADVWQAGGCLPCRAGKHRECVGWAEFAHLEVACSCVEHGHGWGEPS